jgi:hypothetical protein
MTPKLHSQPTPLQALALVTSPRLRLRHFFSILSCLVSLSKRDCSLRGGLHQPYLGLMGHQAKQHIILSSIIAYMPLICIKIHMFTLWLFV